MKVLVTGASGFIGSALCDALLVRGDAVVGLTRDPERAREHEPERHLAPLGADPGTPAGGRLRGRRRRSSTCVGEKIDQRWTDEAKQRIMESRRTGTRNLVGAIAGLERKPRVLVSQSAIGYYGDRGDAIVDEDDGARRAASTPRSSGSGRQAAREVEALGVRLVIVRTGHVLDPSGGLLGELLTPFKLGVGGPLAGGASTSPGSTSTTRSGSCSGRSTTRRSAASFNATAPNPVTNRELLEGARPGPRAAGGDAGAGLRPRPQIRPASSAACCGAASGWCRGGRTDLGYEFRFTELDEALRGPALGHGSSRTAALGCSRGEDSPSPARFARDSRVAGAVRP